MSIYKFFMNALRPSGSGPLARMVGSSALAQIAQLKSGGLTLPQLQEISGEAITGLQDQINALNTLLKQQGVVQVDGSALPFTPPGGSAGDIQINNGAGGFAGEAKLNCTAYLNAAQSLPDSIQTAISWDAESFDNGGLHSLVTAPTRFTVPVAGIYLLVAQIEFAASAVGAFRSCRWFLNGTTILAFNILPPHATMVTRMNCSALVSLAANDYVEFYANQDSGGALNADNGLGVTFGSIVRVG